MEWQGNPAAPLDINTFVNLTEDWFCPACSVGVWIKVVEEKITGYLQQTIFMKEIFNYEGRP